MREREGGREGEREGGGREGEGERDGEREVSCISSSLEIFLDPKTLTLSRVFTLSCQKEMKLTIFVCFTSISF